MLAQINKLWEFLVSKKHHPHPNEDAQDEPVVDNLDSLTMAQTIEQLQKQLAEKEAELNEANDKMLRFKAESDNTRRRAMLDVENANKYGIEKIARELLNVVDSLEKGLEALGDPNQVQVTHLREGMELTYKLLMDILAQFQIKPINPQGEVFDPKSQEALTTQPTVELEPNRVLLVIQKGFTIQDRILRPARVVVSKAVDE